jgi:outer membrane protein OmpA-like peptidoglycan-associated protein
LATTLFKALALLVTLNVAFACANKKFVRTEVGAVNSKIDTLSATVEETQERARRNEERIGTVDAKAESAGRAAQLAQASADAAISMAKDLDTRVSALTHALESAGRPLVYAVTLSEDQGNFKFGKADLPDMAKAHLDDVISQLKVNPRNIFLEIEGHTDSVGNAKLNEEIGMERADAVKRYLYEQHQIPLHKINVISYGEDKPVAPNTTRDGRAQNRRVVVKILEDSVTAASGSGQRPTVRASRIFAGPNQYPPRNFAAYAILAFRTKATSQSRSRYEAICEGYLAAIPQSSALADREVPLSEQMTTVWPLENKELADELNVAREPQLERCADIVNGIDTITSADAFAAARRSDGRGEFTGEGPFLMAWSPSTTFGQAQTLVLTLDLSNVTTVQEATNRFSDWANRIEKNPKLWRNGWDLEALRTTIRQFADKYGARILIALGIPVP